MNIKSLCELALENAKDTLQYRIGNLIRNDDNGRHTENYPYIPVNSYVLAPIIEDLIKSKIKFDKKSFIDIGCGIPIIPKIFEILGCKEVKGLEYDNLYIRMENPKKYLIKGDLLTYDFKKFDILYAYNPIYNNTLMNRGLTNIMNTMKEGATFYFVATTSITPNNMAKLKNIGNGMSNILKYTK